MPSLRTIFTIGLLWCAILVNSFTPEVSSITHDRISYSLLYFDDSSNVLNLNDQKLIISKDDGKTWNPVEGLPEEIVGIWADDVDRKRAFAFTASDTQYMTNDQGLHWQSLKLDVSTATGTNIQTNFANSKLMLLTTEDCHVDEGEDPWINTKCELKVFYTDNGFQTAPKKLKVDNVSSCTFLKTNENFNVGDDKRVLCSVNEYDSYNFVKDSTIMESSDWFATSSVVSDNTGALGSSYILDLRVIQSFVIVIVQTDRYDTFSSVEFYVSKDGSVFNRADFDIDMRRSMYVLLPSTPNSLHIATWSYKNSVSSFASADLYRSDSSGLYHTKSRSNILGGILGEAGVEKIDNIDGAWIANEIIGTDETGLPTLKSRISIDDGVNWDILKIMDDDSCSNDEKCSLNILSSKERDGEGKLVTGPTPGILMGVGSVGAVSSSLSDLSQAHTYISRDGGLHWKKTLDAPCAFAFGDQGNVIIAFPYLFGSTEEQRSRPFTTDELYYSFDQGGTWETYKIDKAIFPYVLTTTIDGSSKKFILTGLYMEGKQDDSAPLDFSNAHEVVYSFDFSKAFDGATCGDNDFEEWYARSPDGDAEGQCLFGHKEKFKRRKQDAKCFVNKLFDDVKVIEESCECSEADYECSLGFVKNEKGECEPDSRIIADNFCQQSSTKKINLPLKQKIPGSLCKGGPKFDDKKMEFDCKKILADDKVSTIVTKTQSFEGSIAQYNYLRASQTNGTVLDETILLRTIDGTIYYSFNGGENFFKFDTLEDPDDEFVAIYLNPYFADYVYLVTTNSKLYVSADRGVTFTVYQAPSDINEFGLRILSFNKDDAKKFIWYGEKNCDNFFSDDCESVAFSTDNGGESFQALLENIRNCYYVGSLFDDKKYNVDENLIYCEQKVKDNNYLALVASNNNFETKQVLFDKIVGIAATGDFVIAAAINVDQKSLEAHVTVDGKEFADALFPADFHVDRQQAYTIIDSSTHALLIHVTTNSARDAEFGTILKSNSNGTSYVKSIDYVNRNGFGYVDFEKVEGLEGVSLINVVDNHQKVLEGKSSKNLKTMITHNDGSEWNYLVPPAVDSNGKAYSCKGKPLEACSLSLHSFTERVDLRDTYSSESAIGMMIGVGNVGSHLLPFNDESTATFMTKDGGITWKEVKKGNYMWEYGDQGTIIVLAPADENPTNTISFSLDEGETWSEYKFVDEAVTVLDLATVPSNTARRFLLFGRTKSNVLVAFTLDFTHIHQRQCKLDFDHPSKDDFEYWSPKHPYLSDNCLFGHEAAYLRRIGSHSDCFIGAAPLNNAYKEIRNCPCTRKDFECDYNYVKASDGTCKLVDGLKPQDHSAVCAKDDSLTEYWEPTGYRKIPLSTCDGGKELDKWIAHPCPGKESEFKKQFSIKGFSLFLTIFLPIAIFFFATWFVYDRGIRRNGGFARFGQIRLDEDDFHPIENNATDKVVNDIVKGLVLAVGALVTLNSIAKNRIMELFSRRSRYERVFGQDHDAILDDDSLFNFNDIDNDEDATEIDSFIQHNDDDFSTTTAGQESADITKTTSETDFQLEDEEDDVSNQRS